MKDIQNTQMKKVYVNIVKINMFTNLKLLSFINFFNRGEIFQDEKGERYVLDKFGNKI